MATFPGFSARRQVSNDGGVQPLWRRDGLESFYLDGRGRMVSVAVSGGAPAEFGVPHVLFETAATPSAHLKEYGIATNGARFLVLEPTGGPGPGLGFLLNWLEPPQ